VHGCFSQRVLFSKIFYFYDIHKNPRAQRRSVYSRLWRPPAYGSNT
jgi:hypothetical protein